MSMRAVFIVGVILIAVGVASLFVPIPRQERHGFEAGPVSFGVETTSRRLLPPAVGATMIGVGVVLLVVGSRRPR